MKYLTAIAGIISSAIDLTLLGISGFLLWLAYTGHITVMSSPKGVMLLIQ